MTKHNSLMLIGCILPLILIFLLPVFGKSGNFLLPLFIVLMLLCHLMMPMHSGKHNHHGGKDSKKEVELRHLSVILIDAIRALTGIEEEAKNQLKKRTLVWGSGKVFSTAAIRAIV